MGRNAPAEEMKEMLLIKRQRKLAEAVQAISHISTIISSSQILKNMYYLH